MAKKIKDTNAEVLSYRHSDRRKNNPEVGVVSPDTDPDQPKTTYAYDPHIDPALHFDSKRFQIEKLIDDALVSGDVAIMKQALEQLKRQQSPYLNWAGRAEKTSFDIDTVSLHVHERMDPASILSAVRKVMKKEKLAKGQAPSGQLGLFNAPFENLPLRDAIDFYKHDRGWANRLIAGDSLLVMNSLLQKESMAGQLQMVYFDPPYGIKYGSNFQPFVGKRDVKDKSDADLTQEPEMIKAFRDTWELGLHSYLTYLRDRLYLIKELLSATGSIFVQISDENVHHVREILDDIFGAQNFVLSIAVKKTVGLGSSGLTGTIDYVIWFAKNKQNMKYRPIYTDRTIGEDTGYVWADENGVPRRLTAKEKSNMDSVDFSKIFCAAPFLSSGYTETCFYDFEINGEKVDKAKYSWKTTSDGAKRLVKANRLIKPGKLPNFKMYAKDFPVEPISNYWGDCRASDVVYAVQTANKVIERCILMSTDPGDLVFDLTCGSGTTAYVAEKWGRRWITCDTSRVALTLAKQRMATASYDYYELKYPNEGLKGGFIYKTVPHVTLKSIANNPEIDQKYDQLHPKILNDLKKLNLALKEAPESPTFFVESGERKGKALDFKKGDELFEWEVPSQLPVSWPQSIKTDFEGFISSRKLLADQIDISIAAHAEQETLYDQPVLSKSKLRITGPFTVEAVPSPMVSSLDHAAPALEADQTISRSGESQRHHDWKDELVKTGIRGKNGQLLKLADLETLPDVKYLHASGTIVDSGERVVVSFGPEYSLLEQRQVEMAMREASELFPRPKMILFCGFDFDPEASKDIDSTKGIIALRVKMNADLLTNDLKKQRSSNQSFWLMGQPDVLVNRTKDGLWQVEVNGFDYFDTVKGELISGGKGNIASWMLDTDYDGRSTFPRQVFFPMAGSKDGWGKLRKEIKAELDESALSKFSGTISLPFESGEFKKIAVKIVDDRGIESLKVLDLED
jgi:adenine-specific DNA-methyltransferase